MKIAPLIISALLVATPAHALTITNDMGGIVYLYALRAKQQEGTVKFDGRCYSACTLFLASDRTCVTPNAEFGFHRAYGASPMAVHRANALMLRTYPKWVRAWLQARGGLTSNLKIMPYSYAVRFIRPCPIGGA